MKRQKISRVDRFIRRTLGVMALSLLVTVLGIIMYHFLMELVDTLKQSTIWTQ